MCKEANRTYRLNSEKIRGRRSRRVQSTSRSRVGYANPTNRIDGAIVSPVPGTTRDRRECIGRIGDTRFTLVDTAGVDGERLVQLHRRKFHYNHIDKDVVQQRWLEKACVEQALEAAKEADLILLMFDARVGVTSDLLEVSRWLRKLSCVGVDSNTAQPDDNPLDGMPLTQKAVVILANKLEGDRWSVDSNSSVLDHLVEAQRVGFGEAIPISAEHGEGLADLAVIIHRLTKQKHLHLQRDRAKLKDDYLENQETNDENSSKPLTLAILGRQNVGKSTLVNSLLKQNRVITGEMPGLTRDAIAIHWKWDGKLVQIADTAGIRRLSQRNNRDNIEDAAVYDAMRGI
jgi:GTP-binding protein